MQETPHLEKIIRNCNTEVFKSKIIHGYQHLASDCYPAYGGELFEKRVDSFMRTLEEKRLVVKDVLYISKTADFGVVFLENRT